MAVRFAGAFCMLELCRYKCSVRWDLWQPGLGVVDITNPEACKWYEAKLDALVDLGVDTFKVRFTSLASRRTPAGELTANSYRQTLESVSRTRT